MDISYTQTGETTVTAKGLSIAMDATQKSKADVLLFSTPQTELPKDAIGFDGPGEYEVKGCMIDGLAVAPGLTAFKAHVEDLRLCFVPKLPEGVELDVESLGTPDVLFLPLEGKKAEAVVKTIAIIEPRIIIPTHYTEAELKAFLSEMGAKDVTPVDKYKLLRKDLPEDRQEIVVFSS